MAQGNGIYKEVEKIKSEVREMREELAPSIEKLADAVLKLAESFDQWKHIAATYIPLPFVIKLLMWFCVLLMSIFAGVESTRWFFQRHLG